MRTGTLYIDGNDAYLQYGVYVVKDGYDELVAMPPLKNPQVNDWHELDGVEADLENPVLDAAEVNISFAVDNRDNRFYGFLSLISDKAYHVFEFSEIRRTYRLRMTTTPKMSDINDLGLFSVRFCNDFPQDGYTYEEPSSNIASSNIYYIDGVDIAKYGLRLLKGTRAELTKTPEVKKNLEISSKYRSGKSYDNSDVRFKSKDVKLFCFMTADTLEDLWRNYDALLHDLIQPEERELYSKELEHSFMFFYKSCKVTEFYPTGKIWLEFTLTLTVIGNVTMEDDDDVVLATQDWDIVITQQGEYAIDLKPIKYSYPSFRFVNSRDSLRFTANGKFRFNN